MCIPKLNLLKHQFPEVKWQWGYTIFFRHTLILLYVLYMYL
jgi:hypothetical protein